MQTFKGTIGLDFKVVVPESFLQDQRAAAQAEDATPFHKNVQAAYPEDDDAFIAAILKNGIRHNARAQLVALLEQSGLGGTVSPASLAVVGIEIPVLNDAVEAADARKLGD